MRRLLVPLSCFVLAVVAGHVVTLRAVPGVIMEAATGQLEERGAGLHRFTLAPRTTPQTQTVVRPSPDLAYSICLFDLPGGEALRVEAGPYDRYASISFFDSRTNNFATVRIGPGDPAAGNGVVLRAPGAAPTGQTGPEFEAPTRRGLILIRRLAPTLADYERVEEAARADRCGLLPA